MSDKQKFMESLGWSKKWIWFDLTGYSPMSVGRTARVDLTDAGIDSYHGHYRALRVQIVNQQLGVVDSKVFLFSDYLRPARIQPHPNAMSHDQLEVIGRVIWDWYILVPESTKPLVEAVEAWVDLHA